MILPFRKNFPIKVLEFGQSDLYIYFPWNRMQEGRMGGKKAKNVFSFLEAHDFYCTGRNPDRFIGRDQF